ncbi:hypothetical protein [Marivita sp.]|jgi:hypothetical protein|uniref:hypothetical protein n=1 Tax=Marivita sp. TaxID=2003365 RepID=UPI003F6B8520
MIRAIILVGLCAALAGCESASEDKSFDRGIDKKPLSQLQAGIWIDPNGCDHWIIDDGVEGYLSPRLDPTGKPVCSGNANERNTAIGDFKGGSTSLIGDVL